MGWTLERRALHSCGQRSVDRYVRQKRSILEYHIVRPVVQSLERRSDKASDDVDVCRPLVTNPVMHPMSRSTSFMKHENSKCGYQISADGLLTRINLIHRSTN
ncbi:hypothetical protein BRADI_1g45718v3 [Brachypodium distachyon]|uniref:Uncharacterized protein n=1 Tax=Brachypodium distachyon TaxID=15368 RepID=A0A2K2DPK0_BRADI|nr:hypothetical protein BRADI_1g45718v3 [Brachypodium distachyon]